MIRAWRYVSGSTEREDVQVGTLDGALDPDRAVVWVDCASPSAQELAVLRNQLGVPAVLLDSIMDPEEPTKLMRYGEAFHVATHDCEIRNGRLEQREIDVVMAPGWLLTVRHPTVGSRPVDVDEVARRFELQRSEHMRTEGSFLLWALFDVLIDRYFDVIDAVDERLETVEEIVFGDSREARTPREVFAIRRDLVAFRRAAAPMREVLNALSRREVSFVSEEAMVHFGDLRDRLLRVIDLLESQRDLLTGLLEADLTVISNRLNEVMKKMTSWGAILIAATLVASIYGMNFPNLPALEWQFGYAVALAIMFGLTVGLYLWFKQHDWL